MDIRAFTDAPEVLHPMDELKAYWTSKKKIISDIVDEEGNQYVDIVMEGGGVLGIALVGYTYALESVGIRFLGIGGTSAGAINALLLAAVDSPSNPKSEKILQILADLEMFSFVDGDSDSTDFIRGMVEGAGWFKMGWKGMQVMDNLFEDFGLCPGNAFLRWLTANLTAAGIRSLKDLDYRIKDLPGLISRSGKKISLKQADPKLALVCADISTETKVIFPDMVDLYFKNPQKVNPARFVRASMSIPGFFHPYRVPGIPQGADAARRWKELAGYKGKLPKQVYFVDGGIMSNFPINLFHVKGVPASPTLGVKLGTDRTAPHKIEKPTHMLGAIFNSARHCADYDFILRNPDYQSLVAYINTGKHDWLNFFIKDNDKVDLFARGVNEAIRFLKTFDWDEYKKVRKNVK